MRSTFWSGEKILVGTNAGEIFEVFATEKDKPRTIIQVSITSNANFVPFLLLFPFGVACTPATFSLPGVPKIKIIIILIKKHEQKLFLNAIKKTKSFLGKYFRFHLSGKTVGFCLELYINSPHTEKVLMVLMITSLLSQVSRLCGS